MIITQNPSSLHARRIGPVLKPDPARVLLRAFSPSSADIARRIVARVMALPEETVATLLGNVLGEFANRHCGVEKFFLNRFTQSIHRSKLIMQHVHLTRVQFCQPMAHELRCDKSDSQTRDHLWPG